MFAKTLFAATLVAALCLAHAGAEDVNAARKEAERQNGLGNYRDAAEIYKALVLNPVNTPKDAAEDVRNAVAALGALELPEETEELLDKAEERWNGSWRVLAAIATLRMQSSHQVVFVEDKPSRVLYWGYNGKNSFERDRVRSLRLMRAAEAQLDAPGDAAGQADKEAFYRDFAAILMGGRDQGGAWRLTALTDLDELPDYEDYGTYYGWRRERGAPVDADGNPLYYTMPTTWDDARDDGQRWRWLLGRIAHFGGDDGRARADYEFASFLARQFGVHTMGPDQTFGRDGERADAVGATAVRTLGDDETIARLATGPRRFSLPDEFNFIAILRRLTGDASIGYRRKAYTALARIYENRQQFAKALACWKSAAALPETAGGKNETAEDAIKRIAGRNGLLEAGPVAPAGTRTRLSYLFRNGEHVRLTARRLNEKLLLADIRAALKAGGKDFFDNPYLQRPDQLGRWVVERDMDKYVQETTAEWQVELKPLPDHYSSRASIEMPFEQAGCYLVEAAMADGNTSRVILWIADLALTQKTVGSDQLFYVADAVTGAPAPKATLSFLGYRQQYESETNRHELITGEFAEHTDDNGLTLVPSFKMHQKNWLVTAEAADGRMAYLGFAPVWAQRGAPAENGGRESAFIITDRPVYRPDQTVNFKIWVGQPTYGDQDHAYAAGRAVSVRIHNPMGEVVYDKTLKTDARGGVADSLVLDASATLGAYMIQTGSVPGYAAFNLEEYKKPEFEVTVETPDKALILGDTAQITVGAKYYFGSPVTDAKVTYTIMRETFSNEWFPPWRWDWLYGSGSSWQSYDYTWYPGWRQWGVSRPMPPWMPRPYSQPELVAEGEGALDADGVFRIPLDTKAAKELYGDRDHKYSVTVEVTDQSRRRIVGTGAVVAVRKPFAATVWADRGYYRAGQEMRVFLKARQPLGAGVPATGKATLFRISYDGAGTPTETERGSWDIATDEGGDTDLRLRADAPGQYRLSCVLTDAEGNRVEGATFLAVRGEKGEGDFRFAAIELVADAREYAPGDTVRLAVNSEKRDAVVLLFVRPERMGANGGLPVSPALLKLANGTAVVDVKVERKDQPNFYCEAITIFDGAIHSEVREIFVPPATKTLTVAVKADREDYLPGAKADFTVTITDADGKPVSGHCVVSVYDKSVEYITGGSNVGDIREHFWKWKRFYTAATASTLKKYGYGVEKTGDVRWEPIGMFGGQEADWNDDGVYTNGKVSRRMMRVDAESDSLAGMSYVTKAASPTQPAPVAASGPMLKEESTRMQADTGGGQAAMAETTVRSEFADTALWIAALDADANGVAAFSMDSPENLTTWKARVWVMGAGTRVGEGATEVTTRKNVIVRPQAPRFLTQKDQVVLSANLHNYLPRAKTARAELVLEGGLLEPAEGVELTRTVELAANGEARVDWLVTARRPGEARVVMKLLTDEESDAAEVKVPVVVHGARRVESFGGVLRSGETETAIKFLVPGERLADRSKLEFSFSPSIASQMLDALPYLIEYPYGCTEQTLNRFLPAVVTRKYLENLGLSLSDANREGKAADALSAEWLKKFGDRRAAANKSPVFDDKELAAMVKVGVERLASMQNADGGWGWFSGAGERSWPHTTSVVVHGLLAARANGVAIPAHVIEQGIDWLKLHREKQVELLKHYADAKDKEEHKGKAAADDQDAFIHMILAEQGDFDADMRDFLYRDRLKLSQSGLAMLGLALHAEKVDASLDVVLRNLEQFVREDAENGTAWLRIPQNGWWWWYNDEIETQAWYLKLLSRTDPAGARASGLAKYLLRNRKNGAYWRSTRDTAYAVEALAEYAVASGEASPDMTVSLYLDGVKVLERVLGPDSILDDNRFALEGIAIEEGVHELKLVRAGGGTLYYGGALDIFSLEDPIAKAGLELKVERAFYLLEREEKTAVAQTASGVAAAGRVEKYRRVRLPSPFDAADGGSRVLKPGDLVEVELTIESKNDYEYLVFEDMKAAGLEALELTSGYTGNRLGAYVEYRDQKVVLFVRYLPRGTYSLGYRFRAETPGAFSALPTFGGGMYATDLFCNSDEMKLRIAEDGVFE